MPDIENEWEKLNRRIDKEQNVRLDGNSITERFKESLYFLFVPKLRPISAIVLILFAVFISALLFRNEPVQPELMTISTIAKEIRKIQLPDGSEVTLNGSSRLEFMSVFNTGKREVKLSGEAFFSVKKDVHPFVIETMNAQTTVLGTKFSIWAREERTRVTVKEGKVKVALNVRRENPVYLVRNQQTTVTKNSELQQPVNVDSDFILGWLDHKLVFNETPLTEVTAEIERFYGAKILLDKEQVSNRCLTGSFSNSSIDSVISMVCLALDLDYEKHNDGYLIRSKK